MYKAMIADFDRVRIGDMVKRNGITYRVSNKTVDNMGGYIELKMLRFSKFDIHRDIELWNKKDFNNRRFRMYKEGGELL